MLNRIGLSLCVSTLLLGGIIAGSQQANSASHAKMTNVTFSLDFIVLGRHSPWYVALEKGYYKEEGLNVRIVPGKGSAHVMQQVESGAADIGFVDVPSLVLARARGATIKMVAINYQKAPYSIFSLDPGANITKPKDMEGLTLGSSADSFVPKIHKAFMRSHGLDPNKLKVTNVIPSARVAALITKRVPSVDFFVMSKPGISRAVKKAKVKTLLLSDHGLKLYSNGIGAKESYIKANPEVMRKFVRASLRGWKYALAHPGEAADMQNKHAKALNRQITIEELAIVKNLAVTDDTKKHGLGWFSAAGMKASVAFMVNNTGMDKSKAPKAEDMYDLSFLPKTPVMP